MTSDDWSLLMGSLTSYCYSNNFMRIFENSADSEKVEICMRNTKIRNDLNHWINNLPFVRSFKCSAESKKTRLTGNEKFKMDHLELCCKLYTKAAQLAPYNSLEFALAFSNRSAVYIRLDQFQECLKDIDISLGVLESIDTKDFNKGQLIIKLLKRMIECLMTLKQYEKAQIIWKNLLELSENVYKISLGNEFITKCNVLSNKNDSIEVNSNENDSEEVQPTVLQRDLIKQILKENEITLPFKSPKLELRFTKAKGRHFIASQNINYGELLLFESPFSFVLKPEYYDAFCFNCCVPLKNYSVPCNYCSNILFCGQNCREESWDTYHRWVCEKGLSNFDKIDISHLALRATIETLQQASNRDDIYNLLTHIDDLRPVDLLLYALTASALTLFLQNRTNFFQTHSHLEVNMVGRELFYNITRLVCNATALTTHMKSKFGTSSSVVDKSKVHIGTVIFQTSSLLNHSCDPNVFSSNILNYSVIKASHSIKKGEEITICYGPSYRDFRFNERQTLLYAQYHFKCKCRACKDRYTSNKFFQIVEGLICMNCNNGIIITLLDIKCHELLFCITCSHTISASEYKKNINKAHMHYYTGLEELEKNRLMNAKKHISKALGFCNLILNPKNLCIAKYQDSLAECYAASGDFKTCYSLMKKCLPAIEERFGKNSLEVAYLLDKMTDIMINHLDLNVLNWRYARKALVYVRRSKKIFDALLSAWDIPYNESVTANIKKKKIILLQLLDGKF